MTDSPGDEADRWQAAVGGDSAAFGELYDAHRDRVFGHALRLTRSSHDAEDVTALVFLEAWRRRDRVRLVDGTILPWLLVTTGYVIRNLERSRRRHRAAMASVPPAEATPDFTDSVDERLDGTRAAGRLREAFTALPARDQDVLTLCVLEELPLAEAAEVLRLPLGTVKSRLSRAKHRLGAALTPDELTAGIGGAL